MLFIPQDVLLNASRVVGVLGVGWGVEFRGLGGGGIRADLCKSRHCSFWNFPSLL